MPDNLDLPSRLRDLKPKLKQPNSAAVLDKWIAKAEQDLELDESGRLGWLVASTVATAALQRALAVDGGARFLLKGGTMLQHRLSVPTRATKDVDGLVRGDLESFIADLDEILAEPWGPVGFGLGEIEVIDVPTKAIKPRRFQLTLTLRGVTWRKVQVEVSPDEGSAGGSFEVFAAPELAGFGLSAPEVLVGLAIRYQIAHKIHASTDPHRPPAVVNDRARDVVDLLLLKDLAENTGAPAPTEILAAARDIFAARAMEAAALGRTGRAWPPTLVAHSHWDADYAKAANSARVTVPLGQAISDLNAWIDRIAGA
ncbi:MAG: nucleotidyl transferase AbiEii/AbiGii toxin family protein [Micrococcales bacterium]|nr:nucleotidyl transferase AbiEii/AbiGii toxin family protein [Micrococcales bacterium]